VYMKKLIGLLLLISCVSVWAGSKIESWKNGEELKFVIRDTQGRFVSYGQLTLENWNDADNRSEWIARKADGTFVTGFKGHLEKFNLKTSVLEKIRLVIRNAKGEFVTWRAIDEDLTAGFERMDLDRDGDKETVYVLRYKNRFVNWAKARLENWKNLKYPVLVVRDTADSSNNGKLLAWIAAEKTTNEKLIYRDPETGKFVSTNK
jgi:hypothetical protein